MLNKVADFIEKHQLLSNEGLHLVAVSGGADSIALLLTLQQLGYRVEVAHCNFHLRGEESNRDEEFVIKLCEEKHILLHLIHFDTKEYATVHHLSVEMAARELRYRYFRQLRQDIGAETVCVAHHRDDAVETFLMNMLRGSGIHGLTGIRPKNDHVVRPLLCCSRQEIVDYLDSIGQSYVIDSTNLIDDVLRNKIRLNLIPLLKEMNPKASENIGKCGEYMVEAEKIVDASYQHMYKDIIHEDSDSTYEYASINEIMSLPSAEYFLHRWLAQWGFNSTQQQQIYSHLVKPSNGEYHSPTHSFYIDRDKVILEHTKKTMKTLKIPESGLYVYDASDSFRVEIINDVSVSKANDVITIDAQNIQFPLTVRPVQTGDGFCPFGMEGHRLVSDFLTDHKLSILERQRQLVVTNGNGNILWIVGMRTDNRYRVTKETSSVLRISHEKKTHRD